MKLVTTICILILILSSSCDYRGWTSITGNGQLAKQDRTVDEFRGVDVSGGMHVFLTVGPTHNVRVEADENLMEYIEMEVDGDVLEISSRKDHNLKPKAGIRIYITAPAFDKLSVTGSGKISSDSKLVSNAAIHTGVTGSGDIKLQVDAPEVHSEISGSGSITLSGATRSYNAEINGSGDIHSFDLLSETSSVDIAGSGNVEIFASKQLDVDVVGSGDVRYKGTAKLNFDKVGGGKVMKVN